MDDCKIYQYNNLDLFVFQIYDAVEGRDGEEAAVSLEMCVYVCVCVCVYREVEKIRLDAD